VRDYQDEVVHSKVASWIHFLGTLPSGEFDNKSQWVRSGLVLNWAPTSSGSRNRVTLICFEPPPAFWLVINRLYKSADWEDILSEPYLLVNMAFEAWYRLVDENAWKVLDLARESEKAS